MLSMARPEPVGVQNARHALREAVERRIREPTPENAAEASRLLEAYRREVEVAELVRKAMYEETDFTRKEPVVFKKHPVAFVKGRPVAFFEPSKAWRLYAAGAALLFALGAALEAFWR